MITLFTSITNIPTNILLAIFLGLAALLCIWAIKPLKDISEILQSYDNVSIEEQADIICKTRSDLKYKWMNDSQIQNLIKIKIKKLNDQRKYKSISVNEWKNISRFD